ncbi:DUF1367 family protein [Methylocucumis oryzae]|uniref:DUF1367 family protein n=1 Tax=Methylocucumis oryzae TaxID=1632867 RepID=A0A0F3IN82_9GAMM|nr:DUF1367 family protein [Methylocucumis oryzae]KJV08018.1 hypothetical protein VZ94_00970 [Methylocucumis oryzae]
MATAFLVKAHGSGYLMPDDESSIEVIEKIKAGSVVKAEITQPRNWKFHKKFFALVNVAFEAWDMPGVEYKGMQVNKNRDRFRKDLIILAGYGHPVVNLRGEVRYEAKSISFGSMDELEFEELYSRVVDVVLAKVLMHYSRSDLDEQVNRVLSFV